MHADPNARIVAVVLSVLLHLAVLASVDVVPAQRLATPQATPRQRNVVSLELLPLPAGQDAAPQPARAVRPRARPAARPRMAVAEHTPAAPVPDRQPASMEAPPPPSAQDWALAARYTPKNSKRYRWTWGQQVRSMMGTAVEGPDQGVVRFRVEIAPDGTLAALQTLWSTSAVAERLARRAIQHMPPLPPTPTGQPLVFERTISFQPFASDGPPIYANDCLPDPPVFRNPFAWDGKSPQVRGVALAPPSQPDPKQVQDCLEQLPRDTIEAESAHDRRQFERWESSQLGR